LYEIYYRWTYVKHDGLLGQGKCIWKNKIRINQFKRRGLKERTQLYLALGSKEKVKIIDYSSKAWIQHKKSRGT